MSMVVTSMPFLFRQLLPALTSAFALVVCLLWNHDAKEEALRRPGGLSEQSECFSFSQITACLNNGVFGRFELGLISF